jgi:DNA-binding transcriptional regulator LsrR (DeoR family)
MTAHAPDLKDLQKTAALYCEGVQPDDIAIVLGIEPNQVQSLIETAEGLGFFARRPILTLDELSDEVKECVTNESLTAALRKAFQNRLETLHMPIVIAPSPPAMFRAYVARAGTETDLHREYAQAEITALSLLCRRAGELVTSLLVDGNDHVIGLNWGATVGNTIRHIAPSPSLLGDARFAVVSLFGDLEFNDSERVAQFKDVNCNDHVNALARRLGPNCETVLLNVPGFISHKFAQDKTLLATLRAFVGSHASYKRIFGAIAVDDPNRARQIWGITNRPPDAKLVQMDTLITGFGAPDSYTNLGRYLEGWLSDEETQALLKLVANDKIVGDLGGHLIPSAEAMSDAEVLQFVKEVGARLVAVQPGDFVTVASRHLETGKGAGVIGIASGARKAKLIFTLLSKPSCPISRLVIDTHCALALLALLDPSALAEFASTPEGRRLASTCSTWSADTRAAIPLGELC